MNMRKILPEGSLNKVSFTSPARAWKVSRLTRSHPVQWKQTSRQRFPVPTFHTDYPSPRHMMPLSVLVEQTASFRPQLCGLYLYDLYLRFHD